MEIRLTFLNENEIECFMNSTMHTNIRKNTSFNFKLSFARWDPWAIEVMLHQTCPRTNKIALLKINRKNMFL